MREIRRGRFEELDGPTVFALARLRQSVFVVEQECPYPDLDEHDTAPETVHFWAVGDGPGEAVACLRLLRDTGGHGPVAARTFDDRALVGGAAEGRWRIGRVCCAPAERGTGLSGRLMTAALETAGPEAELVLDSQTYAAGFYRKYGFTEDGEEYLEDGIPHVPMRRPGK
ncbi:GNAT family N-acetyltransferase [Glycomyces albidus]|uniref:GNAT family N-acetyltransferase n=1 Tax=Glycomyces albidus TaxID=2656774 RepID=A0A6L5G9W8_9ACTN|nr:GNAT family N-acetyltransferase [Glycomyces albidus]MQM26475.1 GNAT family N-acetyltransferase [Glycomyces albidus]